MNVTRVKLKVNQALFGRCYFKGTVFYISDPFRKNDSFHEHCDVFNEDGNLLGEIKGPYRYFGDGKVFEKLPDSQQDNVEG